MMSWTYQIFSWSSATLVTWFTPGKSLPSIIKMPAWVVLLGSFTQKVKLLHSYYCKVITQSP